MKAVWAWGRAWCFLSIQRPSGVNEGEATPGPTWPGALELKRPKAPLVKNSVQIRHARLRPGLNYCTCGLTELKLNGPSDLIRTRVATGDGRCPK